MRPKGPDTWRRSGLIVRGPAADRWTRWAGALRARHERRGDRQAFLRMILLRRYVPLQLVAVRHERFIEQHGPQINVAIELFLQGVARQRLARERARQAATLPATRRDHQSAVDLRVASRPLSAHVGAATEDRATRRAGARAEHSPSPLVRIVRRLERSTDLQETAVRLMLCGGRRLLRAELSRERVEWFTPHTRRRGTLLQRAVALRPASPPGGEPPVGVPTASRRLSVVSAPHVAFDIGGQRAAAAATHAVRAPQPAVNVEELTERVVREIDRRMVAHRERLGRPY